MKPRSVVLGCVVAAFALTGCMEVDQGMAGGQRQGKYQGKTDSRPWDNSPLAYGDAKWSKGDRASWETQIKRRSEKQNENKRIYQ